MKRAHLHLRAETGRLAPVTWITHGLDVAFGRIMLRAGKALEADHARQEEAFEFLLEQLARTVETMGAKLLVVYIPTANDPPPAVLLRSVAKLDLLLLDMTDAFVRDHEDPATSPFYIPGDGHPSVVGHALIEAIVALVRREKILSR